MRKSYDIWDIDRNELARAVRAIPKIDPKLSIIDKMRFIVNHRQANRVDGLYVDMNTANVIIQVHNALNDKNKILFVSMNIRKMATVAFKLVA